MPLNILLWGFYIILAALVILLPVKLANYLYYDKKIKINRWILAFVSPFIVIIPKLIFPKMPRIILVLLISIFAFCTVLFFETTRLFLENKEIKGVIDYSTYIVDDHKSKKKKKKRKK